MRGLRENDDRSQEKIADPEVLEHARYQGGLATKHALLTALLSTAMFVLLA